jgi:hypothetical protein
MAQLHHELRPDLEVRRFRPLESDVLKKGRRDRFALVVILCPQNSRE